MSASLRLAGHTSRTFATLLLSVSKGCRLLECQSGGVALSRDSYEAYLPKGRRFGHWSRS